MGRTSIRMGGVVVYIEPHERLEAIQAYRDCLTDEQVDEMENAPETAIIRLDINLSDKAVDRILVIEEG